MSTPSITRTSIAPFNPSKSFALFARSQYRVTSGFMRHLSIRDLPHDGTQGDAGYSSIPWIFTQDVSRSATWNCETFATKPERQCDSLRHVV